MNHYKTREFIKNKVSFCFTLLVIGTFFAGCKTFSEESGLGCFVPYEWSGYQNGRVIHAKPISDFKISKKNPNTDYLDFFALGCAGSGNQGQKIVAEQMAHVAGEEKISLVLYLGDNFYGCGVSSVKDKQWKTKFENIYDQKRLNILFYPVLGNHDHAKSVQAQIAYSKISSRWRMPARYYTFSQTLKDGTKVDFFALDTQVIVHEGDPDQLKWLDGELQKSRARWKIVYGHHPLYTGDHKYKGQPERTRAILEPIFVKYRVDLYLAAHSHNIEAIKPVSGVHYIVSGAGSRPRNVTWSDQTIFASAEVGFAWLSVSSAQIDVQFVGGDGKVGYAYTIKK